MICKDLSSMQSFLLAFGPLSLRVLFEIELQELHLIVCKYEIASNPSSRPRKWIRKAIDTPIFSQALADALRINQTITLLDLRGCNIGDDGLKAWWWSNTGNPRSFFQGQCAGSLLWDIQAYVFGDSFVGRSILVGRSCRLDRFVLERVPWESESFVLCLGRESIILCEATIPQCLTHGRPGYVEAFARNAGDTRIHRYAF